MCGQFKRDKKNGAEDSAPLLCSAEGGDRGTKRGP